VVGITGNVAGEALSRTFEHHLSNPRPKPPVLLSNTFADATHYSRNVRESKSGHAAEIARLYQVQHAFRSMYGKRGVREPDIGDHPDFTHLKGTDETVYCPITTLFMDIEGSTRLGLLYPLEDVRRIKNAFIRTAIEVITSFDGHVHRIMGDAVLAYFGGCGASPHGSAIDGLNSAAVLRLLAERVVAPKLDEMGFSNDFGVRIGVDHGPKEKVLWSSYGYPRSDEVTATSFYVDVAAKLQQAAGRNQIMIGHSLKSYLDLPDELAGVKLTLRGGHATSHPFVTPNHTDRSGEPINYRQYVFSGDDYLRIGAFGQSDRQLLAPVAREGSAHPLRIDAAVSSERGGVNDIAYPPCSSPVGKLKWVRFTPRLPYLPRLPYTVVCNAINHGEEALRLAGEDRGNHSREYTVSSEAEHKVFEHWEPTAYRGLHYLSIVVRSQGTRFEGTVGVFIE
jgi:adenylate cyclase